MPREQKTTSGDSGILDAFAVTKNHKPSAFETVENSVQKEKTPDKPKPATKRAAKKTPSKPEQPEIRRMGRRRTGRNIPFNQTVNAQTANAFYEAQEQLDIPMGAVLERAIKALKAELDKDK